MTCPIEEIVRLRDVLMTSLGPLSRDKASIFQEEVFLTNDGYNIAKLVGGKSFSYRYILEQMFNHELKYGDGTTSLGLFITVGYLESLRLIKSGVISVHELNNAIKTFLNKELKDIVNSISRSLDVTQNINQLVHTMFQSKRNVGDIDTILSILKDIISTGLVSTPENCEIQMFEGTLGEPTTEIINGVVLRKRVFSELIDRSFNQIAILQVKGGIYFPETYTPNQILQVANRITSKNVKILLVQETIDSQLEEHLRRNGILVLKRMNLSHMMKLSKISGAPLLSSFSESFDEIGYISTVRFTSRGNDHFIEFISENSQYKTILCSGMTPSRFSEFERIFQDVLKMIYYASLSQENMFTPGGGAFEASLYKAIEGCRSINPNLRNVLQTVFYMLLKSIYNPVPNPNQVIHKMFETPNTFFDHTDYIFKSSFEEGVIELLTIKERIIRTGLNTILQLINTDIL